MSFSGTTPESLLPRSDSRNPATTCKGITKAGRPCRRPIDAKPSEDDGVIAVVSVIGDGDDEEVGAAAYFCWQHKDQAERLAAQTSNGPPTHLYPLKERNSIDTLVERLGVLEVDDAEEPSQRKRRSSRQEQGTSGMRPPKKINRPATWDKVEGPLMSVPSDVMAANKPHTYPAKPSSPRTKPSFWSSLCCGSADVDDIEEPQHKQKTSQAPVATATQEKPQVPVQQPSARPARVPQDHGRRPSRSTSRPRTSRRSSNPAVRTPLGEKPARPINKMNREESETAALLRYIPKNLSPQLTSTLLAELSKPISPHDDEGYIYIFWLTPDSAGPAPKSAASSLLVPPSSRPDQNRRTADVLRQFSVKKPQQGSRSGTARRSPSTTDTANKDRILLKIGRANNVHRRMHEWTRQCGYSLSLVRYYPHVPSTPSPAPAPHATPAQSRRRSSAGPGGVRKVPHAMRVERLIHLELGEQRVVKKCEACGKEHREWFEVEASREGVKKVDEVVKRWVDWAERTNGRLGGTDERVMMLLEN
ncbi:hypothetical protein IAQ61_011687 [Plenodomus lingam]|uniref:Bacteriophage T5 Orf172 DNA-binding domain-containing protein n=1 Tax=Leptosphaeria maculans (strain JN3 / isolate v23.1.3 / race Av1-4-5-6-7-8) TaxID=985895 RepID=E5AAT8_LEPMJ|nr:hypothetical protein LEMA_P019090.1 [Plenodomus lingam JN3]KAH9859904.1 hypothetical protein IAQ61_011687 [Plenodomus lingam]CBY00779.1 hypothetical protein LEMA_P019090.1 [Plenodomus lingam JN3]